MAKFATGYNAVGICARCGFKSKLLDLEPDGYQPGLLVHSWCRDIAHPAEKPVRMTEGIALRRPAPDIDDDSEGAGGTLRATLFSGLSVHGGGT